VFSFMPPVMEIAEILAAANFVMLRYETEYTPCTGITAVTRQERRHFGRSLLIAPWCPRMKEAQAALAQHKVVATSLHFEVAGRPASLLRSDDGAAAILFVAIEGAFQGLHTPYDTPDLKHDTLRFGLAVRHLLLYTRPAAQFVWAADWECVPALLLVRPRQHTVLTLHNTFDAWLAYEAGEYLDYWPLRGERTALQVGLEAADVVTTVNRGFAWGLRHEMVQRQVLAHHLQHLLYRVVGINNAGFSALPKDLSELAAQFRSDFSGACARLRELKAAALASLPEPVRQKAAGKVLVVSMGRRVAQKQHDVLVESTRAILHSDSATPLLTLFTTVKGDEGSEARLARVRALETEFPGNVICQDGRIDYFQALMAAADFNCMPSLYEPHGGAFDGLVVPIARAVDGLAEQICALRPDLSVMPPMYERWHAAGESPTGFLFREDPALATAGGCRELLESSPSPDNSLFRGMVAALRATLNDAVKLRQSDFPAYARLVAAGLDKQQELSWAVNLGGVLALIEVARLSRPI
jgi:glycogen synthase